MAEVYRVRFRSRSVRKELDGLDDETYLRIMAAIHHLRENPRPPSMKKLTGQDTVNPLATILSAAILLCHSLRHEAAAAAIETAVSRVLEAGYRTPDIWQPGATVLVGLAQMGDLVVERLATY